MSCTHCSRGIERGLGEKPGILSARVFLGDESAEIQYEDSITSPDRIIAEISDLGYSGRVLGTEPEESGDRLPVLFTGILTVPIVYWSMFAVPSPANLISQMILSGVILMTTGRRFFAGAARAWKNRRADMNVLVSLGLGASWFYSAAILVLSRASSEEMVHFEAVAMLVLFISLGKTLEGRARHQASESLRGLTLLQHGEVRRLIPASGREMEPQAPPEVPQENAQEKAFPPIAIPHHPGPDEPNREGAGAPAEEADSGELAECVEYVELADISDIRAGDRLKILPGERFAIDGRILGGESAADESLLTGEAMPVPKRAGMAVISGTMNLSGELIVKVERAGPDSTLQTLIRTVRRAQADRPRIQRFADQVSEYFVPAIIALAACTFAGWLLAGYSLHHALMHAVTVLVVACPCALGLATPMAVIVASGIAMQRGLLVKKPSALEALADVSFFLLDKTGTLTRGTPEVQFMQILPDADREAACRTASALAGKSVHPLSRALVGFLRDYESHTFKLSHFEERRGYGLTATDPDGRVWTLGNQTLMAEKGVEFPPLADEFLHQALTPVFLSCNQKPTVIFGLADLPREEAKEAIAMLHQRGITTVMVSGDRRAPAEATARAVGIAEIHAEVLPEGKLGVLRDYLRRGKAAFVGDGINDSPALSAASVGLAMGSGADIAQEATDLVLMGKDLRLLPFAVDLSRKTLKKIRQNLIWATVYNLLALPLASGILVPFLGPGFHMNPAVAGLAMACSSISVVLNSLFLVRTFAKKDTFLG